MTEDLTWRAATAEDAALLFALFSADQAAEFAPLGLSNAQLQPLLQMQFRARELTYAQNHPNALDTILCVADGTPVGRHLIERQMDGYRGIDLAIQPECRGRGIGTWALRQIQQLAAVESVPFRLRVLKTNPASRLYERLGFVRIGGDEIALEMEWQPAGKTSNSKPATAPPAQIVLDDGESFDRIAIARQIAAFLCEIGLEVDFASMDSSGFLPGIQVLRNGLKVDLDKLLYPGDLLHEAGHLAVMPPSQRNMDSPMSAHTDRSKAAAEEMAALSWSYAAALHLDIPPEIVFHQNGYRGQAAQLLRDFANGNAIGLPYLWWIGLTTQSAPDQPSIFPRMLRWLREEPPLAHEPEPELAHTA